MGLSATLAFGTAERSKAQDPDFYDWFRSAAKSLTTG